MNDDVLRKAIRSGGCRLCLAPDTECVPIFATAAADKEPLSNKIFSCVNIKVQQADRMSNRICHACISFLNSWQSFKNRCHAAQKKQQTFLDIFMAKERAKKTVDSIQMAAERQRQLQQQRALANAQQQRILKSALTQSMTATPYTTSNTNSFDVGFIKEEPDDVPSDLEEIDGVDPTQFLAQDDDEGVSNGEDQPPILTSLGLTHINHVNQPNCLNNDTDQGDGDDSLLQPQNQANRLFTGKSQAACTICNMQFSNRANARRHERNIHGIKIDLLYGNSTIIPPKERPQISITAPIRKRLPDAPIVYDYAKPEKYRSLLTEPRLNFIKRHLEFLEQYQTMTCKCCDKQFPTYKFFMAHMRKRYDTLSRNLCFKCLKQFQTKPQFIAHLKKKNCLNMYKVFLADDTISKDPLPMPPARYGSKEIIANKTYGCRLCAETFRLKSDFRTHVLESHSDAQKREIPGATSCGYCHLEFEDSGVRRRHFNNVECMVFLLCGTCNERFNTHPAYIEHVYATHIPTANAVTTPIKNELTIDAEDDSLLVTGEDASFSSSKARNPQNCKVCGKQYNNYYNVLRHMESKHPDQLPRTYRCELCDVGYPRQVELREHMLKVHGQTVKIKREVFNCRGCNGQFDNRDAWIGHQAEEHSKFFCHLCEEETDDKAAFEAHLIDHAKSFKCTVCQHAFSSERGLETHLAVVHNMTKDEMPDAVIESEEYEGDGVAVECAVDIQVNGDDSDVESDDDGNDADNDETMESAAKRIKLDDSNMVEGELSVAAGATSTPVMAVPNQLSVTCRVCKETFLTRPLLILHMRNAHSSVRPNLPLNATNTNPLQQHNVNNRLRCRICQKRIHTKNGYKRHMLTVHQVKDCVFIKCKICPSEFSNDKGLKVHMFRTHNITVQQMQQDESLLPIPKQESTSLTEPTPPPPKIAAKQMFECDICHTVYRNRDQLKSHKSIVHNIVDSTSASEQTDAIEESLLEQPIESWWQCRYCNESFNASKKLTIHMNSHSEYDNTQTTCKDCGNVYGTRKSLWVHRQKKHPRIPNPSPCELCDKTFFDKTELFHHLKTHSNDDVFSHLQEMQQQLEAEQESRQKQEQLAVGSDAGEQLSCHICSQRFHDKRVLSKHLRMHEQQKQQDESSLFGNSPLAAMLADTSIGGADENNSTSDYNYPSYKGQMVDGQYACDMCPKTFPLMNALKVHRGWHFRSPDGRQITDSNNIWHPDSVPPSKGKRSRSANPPVCPYCNSTFASGNNLRRHIVEVHKRNEAKMRRENGTAEVFIEKECECQACSITFSNRSEWVDHKISHARTMKPSTTYEWGCEICGKIFTRKERLLVHMLAHLNSKEEDLSQHSNERQSELGFESNSQSSMSSQSQSHSMQSHDSNNLKVALQKAAAASNPKQSVSLLKQPSLLLQQQQKQQQLQKQQQQQQQEKLHQLKQDETANQSEPNSDRDQSNDAEPTHSCDLCQLFFRTAKELRAHVITHINGPESGSTTALDTSAANQEFDEYDEDDVEGDDVDGEQIDDGDDEYGSDIDEQDPEAEDGDGERISGEMYEDDLAESDSDGDDDDIENDADVNMATNNVRKVDGFNCRICGSSSESHIDMIRCMENHKNKSDIQCESCEFYFTRNDQLIEHDALCHPKNYDEDDDDDDDMDEEDEDDDEEEENI